MALRIGIVGIGYGQHVLLPVFQTDERAVVEAICASTQDRAQTVADEHHVPLAFGDWREMLSHVDAVAVAVPPTQQPEIVLAALEMGKPVFAE
jgi:predicted dehydrogenase